ncbi:MAG: competence/damage-inducible protein A [Vulcanimicrobiaceae bacterium]
MLSVEVIAVGTELLLGQLLDTNTAYIVNELAGAGIDVYGTHAVGDNRERIAKAIGGALERADGVITTGGLGPTIDDLTKEAVCDALGLDAELDRPSLDLMEAFFRQVGREMRDNNRKQAMLPRGSHVLRNPNGTAPGFVAFGRDGKFVACMPGVPREMKPMLANELLPFLRKQYRAGDAIYTRVIHTINIGESEIDYRIDDLFRTLENPKIAVLAHDYRADVKIMAKAGSRDAAEALIAPIQRDIEPRLAGHVYGYDDQTLAGAVNAVLQQRNQTVAVAESCTGGAVCEALTSVPGSSKSFIGGVVAYANSVKISMLDVEAATIELAGAVSEEVAIQMAAGVRTRLAASIGIATTGVAGPEGGTPEKPVGLVWLGLAHADGTVTARRLQLRGDRAAVQARATTAALGLLWNSLREREPIGKDGS